MTLGGWMSEHLLSSQLSFGFFFLWTLIFISAHFRQKIFFAAFEISRRISWNLKFDLFIWSGEITTDFPGKKYPTKWLKRVEKNPLDQSFY